MQSEEQKLAYINREMALMDYPPDMDAYRAVSREKARLFLCADMLDFGVGEGYNRKK